MHYELCINPYAFYTIFYIHDIVNFNFTNIIIVFDICICRIANPYNTEGWDNISQPTGISLPLFNEVYPEGQGVWQTKT